VPNKTQKRKAHHKKGSKMIRRGTKDIRGEEVGEAYAVASEGPHKCGKLDSLSSVKNLHEEVI
jgi:hypothetical protein